MPDIDDVRERLNAKLAALTAEREALYEALEQAADALKITAEWAENFTGYAGTVQGIRNDEAQARAALARARGES